MRALVAALAALLLTAAPAWAAGGQESTFQDDNELIYADTGPVTQTLDELKSLGVDRLRITLAWRAIAPGNEQDTKPAGFDGADPSQYPPGAWDRWDRVVTLARERGMDVNFDLTPPAPDWATGTPDRPDIDPTYQPDPVEFGKFVRAAATRYDGNHGEPRVSYWSIGNEPNQPGWLTPQWVQSGNTWIEGSPQIYRAMVDQAWTALQDTGHGGDTILIGETAPKGVSKRSETRAIAPLRFIRRLYCLDDNLQVLQGAAATAQGCPTGDQIASFPADHPALFHATGWAHHPYELTFAPDTPPRDPDWVTIANLDALQGTLRRVYLRYDQPLQHDVPIYLTEFGYQTQPEDELGVTHAKQAAYMNQAEYIAWRDKDVRTLAQFLLRDDGAPASLTFQSGLRTHDGARKSAWTAYRFPIWIARPTVRRGQRLHVWGLPRPAPDGSRPKVQVQFRRTGTSRWRRVATVRGDAVKGYVNASLRMPGTGRVRLSWNGLTSRSVAIRRR